MSDVFYPLGIISQHKVTPYNSVQTDKFEDGTTSSRLLWSANNFKRQFNFTHEHLTLAEYRYLRSFYAQRSGMYDSFWYRDNVNRKGNAKVRFSAAIEDQMDGVTFTIPVKLDEISPVRALPERDEIQTAAGFAPVLWYDANREFYLNHAGQTILENTTYDAATQKYPGVWTGGFDIASFIMQQYQIYHFNGSNCARTGANISELTGTQPAATLFVIAKLVNFSTKNILCSVGAMGPGHALGIALAADNKFEPWIGDTETWTNARVSNSGSFQSLAVVWTGSSNSAALYNNAALIGTDTNTRSLTAGPFAMGSALDGTMINGNGQLAHVLLFAGALSLAQIKALHNLLGYQCGLTLVP